MVDSSPTAQGPGVEHQRDAVAELLDDMLGAGRAEPAGAVGRGRGERAAERLDHRVRRPARRAERDRRKPGNRQRMDRRIGRERHHERQRTGPEFLRQPLGASIDLAVAPRHIDVSHMTDQRVEARPPFGGEDARHRLAVRGIGGEAVDRLRRQRDQLAARQRRGGIADGRARICCGQDEMAHARVSPAGGGASSVGV